MDRLVLVPIVVTCLWTGTASSQAEPPFREIGEEVGLDFVHVSGALGDYYAPEIMGAGGGWIDFDGDGDLDPYLVQGGPVWPSESPKEAPMDRLFRTDSGPKADGATGIRLVDVTRASGIRGTEYGMGMAVGDIDNDGGPDLYLTNFGPNQLWNNRGDGTFVHRARRALSEPRWSVPAIFFDMDRDGWLDLFVGNYLAYDRNRHRTCRSETGSADYCGPAYYPPLPDRIFRNRGDGQLEEMTRTAGLAEARGPALGAISLDFDRDLDPDLYVANDQMPNFLWVNRGDGTFSEEALLAGAAVSWEGKSEASMGIDAGDFDRDGDEDLFMAHLTAETNTLYVNDSQGRFRDDSVSSGLGPASWSFTGFGAVFVDYDNDGWLDILTVNGTVSSILEQLKAGDPYPFHQRNQLFRNEGGRFREITEEAGKAFGRSEVSRAAALGDVDNDGDLDVLITNNRGPARLLENRVGQENRWVGIRPVGPGNRDALGIQIVLRSEAGSQLHRRARSHGSYAAARDPRLVVGLGSETPTFLEARWPEGAVRRFVRIPLRRYLVLVP